MTEAVIVAVLGLLGVLGTASLAHLTRVQARTWNRLARAEATNRGLWEYTRLLIDHIYRGLPAPPPPPPDHIAHLYEPGDAT